MQLERIRKKLGSKASELSKPLTTAQVEEFEDLHGVTLPLEFRRFIIEIGNGGIGPPEYGLIALGDCAADMRLREREIWTKLPNVTKPFPFTRFWIWENGATSTEGSREQVGHGSILIGNDGCGMYWHLIVSGPERGVPWMICGEGIQPVCPKRDFLQWYEDWLDGLDSFYGFSERA